MGMLVEVLAVLGLLWFLIGLAILIYGVVGMSKYKEIPYDDLYGEMEQSLFEHLEREGVKVE